jgi:hypothetical protein
MVHVYHGTYTRVVYYYVRSVPPGTRVLIVPVHVYHGTRVPVVHVYYFVNVTPLRFQKDRTCVRTHSVCANTRLDLPAGVRPGRWRYWLVRARGLPLPSPRLLPRSLVGRWRWCWCWWRWAAMTAAGAAGAAAASRQAPPLHTTATHAPPPPPPPTATMTTTTASTSTSSTSTSTSSPTAAAHTHPSPPTSTMQPTSSTHHVRANKLGSVVAKWSTGRCLSPPSSQINGGRPRRDAPAVPCIVPGGPYCAPCGLRPTAPVLTSTDQVL